MRVSLKKCRKIERSIAKPPQVAGIIESKRPAVTIGSWFTKPPSNQSDQVVEKVIALAKNLCEWQKIR